MIKLDATVKKETRYITYFCVILSVAMQIIFILLGKWNYRVLLGNLLSLFVAVGNFLAMGITVQKAVSLEGDEARKLIKSSQKLRNAGVFVALAIGVLVPVFNVAAVLVPMVFPKIAAYLRPLIKDKKEVIDK